MKKLFYLIFFCVLSLQGFSQCSGFQIVADKSSVCAPEIIRFQVLNPVAGSTYEWNVGNGTVFGADTLYSFYSTAQTIDAQVKITTPLGLVCVVNEDSITIVNEVPVPEFSTSSAILCDGPDSILLTDITPNSVKRSWVVDGTNYGNTSPTIRHDFLSTGAKKISLIVEDNNGCQGVREFVDTIKIHTKPAFDFSADVRSGCAPKTTTFTLTSNPNVSPLTKKFYWSFPGATNTIDSGATPAARTYTSTGQFNALLNLELSNGCTYEINKTNYLTFGETVTLNVTATSSTQCFDQPITFNQSTSGLPGSVTWDFSGLSSTLISSSNDSASVNASGVGNLDLTVTHNHFGCISTANYSQIVEIKGVKADFSSLDNFHCAVPHTVHLDNESDTLDATALTYRWEVLNGGGIVQSSTNENPDFTFNTLPASYDVKLVAIGDNGCTDSIIRSGFIYQDSLITLFDVAPKKVCAGQEFQVVNNTKPSTYLAADSFYWYFYDADDVTIIDSSDERAPTFTYNNTGLYNIRAVGFNVAGCRDTLDIEDVIEVISPNLDFEVLTPIVCSGDRMFVNGKSTPDDAGFDYLWTLKHKTSTSSYSINGDSTYLNPLALGEYHAIYQHSIAGGCVGIDTVDAWVNGLKAKVDLDTSFGCAPLVVNPSTTILDDFHEGFAGPSYTYHWSVAPDNGVSLIDTFSPNPQFEFAENGDYIISVEVINSAGCSFTASSMKVLSGVRSGLEVVDDRICLGDTLVVFDNSYNGVSDVAWSLRPGATYTLSNNDSNINKIVLEQPGTYELRQIVTNNNICHDTSYYPFEVIEVIADFEAVDSFLNCAPIYAEFVSKSSFADTLIWDFGTGDIFKTTTKSAGTIYAKNSGFSDGYDIKLIAKNVQGCTDTLLKEDYMVVAGPVPKFSMTNFSGCEPVSVTFTDESEDGSYFFMNYNDGSPLDSSKNSQNIIGPHSYRVQSFSALRQTVMPSIIVYDSLGCAAVFEPLDSVEIFRSPEIKPVFANGTEFCNPFNVVFEDTGDFVNTYQWKFDGVNVSNQSKDSLESTQSGNHSLELIATNTNNCKDTMTQIFGVYEKPKVSFTVQDTICIDKIATYKASISSSNTVDFFEWNFGEPGTIGNLNTSDLNASFAYQSSGLKEIKLYGGLINGCLDSAIQTITITDATSIDNPQINFVTFKDNYTVEVNYEKSTTTKFNAYNITSSAGVIQVDDIDQTTFETNFASAPLVADCYTLHISDYCDLAGLNSETHCFMVLNVSSLVPYQNELTWTPYIGWANVDEYNVFRKDENDVFVRIGTVAGDVTNYTDLGLCDTDYEYYVQATHPSEAWLSNSYTVSNRPIYVQNSLSSSVKNVSVSGENEISVDWEKSVFSEFSNYKVLKYETTFDNLISETPVTDTFFIDSDVETNEYSYIYRVVEQDRCGYENTPDKEGKSILLRGRYNEGSDLFWTEYQNWENGVKHYNVEIDKSGEFEFTHKNSHHDRDYIDRKFYRDIIGEYCYRVYAVGNDGDTSYSNVVCLSGEPKVLIPTGFTPNGDDLNDGFNPVSQFLQHGELEEINSFLFSIYNRWGEKVFETNNAAEGWNGTYKGTDCQQGSYIYTLTATGINKQKLHLKGTITLLR